MTIPYWKYRSGKKKYKVVIGVLVSVILLLLILFLSGGLETIKERLFQNSSEGSLKGQISQNSSGSNLFSNSYCEENIIPDNLIFAGGAFILDIGLKSTWKDGTGVGVRDYVYAQLNGICRKGSNKGENVNYLYCENLIYSKTFIDESGNIGETITYEINLILGDDTEVIKKTRDSIAGSYVEDWIEYPVIDYTCKKI